jgi:hypothetical protein
MYQSGPMQLIGEMGEMLEMIDQRVHQRSGPVADSRMDHHTRCLIEDDHVFVFEHDVERNIFGNQFKFPDRLR